MDLTLTDDQELISRTARELLAARVTAAGARAVADERLGHSTALWKEMIELGWLGMAVPEVYGGVGAGFLESCLLIEQLGAFQVPSPYLATVACCAAPIAAFGTEAQRAYWLPEIAAGRVLSYAPPGGPGGWSPAESELLAVPAGDGYRLSGTARFVPFAEAAADLLVVAALPGEALAAFLVDARAPGISRQPVHVLGSDRPCHLRFSGVAATADRVLGAIGDGPAVAETLAAFGAAATAAEMVGGAQRVLDTTVEYARTREQFGTAIGSFQAVQHHCADMAIDVLGARFIAYEAIWRLTQPGQDPAEVALSVAVAKAWVSEAYERVCALGHQVHGAIGFTAEHDLHLYQRHAMRTALSFGDGDFHTDAVADRIGLPAR